MLETLYVKDFAIVGEAEIGFGTGLTVVTGETGAGKSLLVDALLLLAGQRADAGVVRHGSERAELIAQFQLADAPSARAWLAAEEFDDGETHCQLRRVIRSEGTSRAWINGRPATLAQLAALTERLLEIHGQHEHQALLDKLSQLALLDAYGDHREICAQVAALAARWRELETQMRVLSNDDDNDDRIALLAHQVEELERHALTPAELAALDEAYQRLANAGQLIQGGGALAEALDGDGEYALLRQLARAQAEVQRLARVDAQLEPVQSLIEAAQIQLVEANASLTRWRDALDLDPERLAETEAKIAKLHELSRRHRVAAAELKTYTEVLRAELEGLRGAGEKLAALARERGEIERRYADAAARLSALRAKTAQRLGRDVSALMAELGMSGGRFEPALEASARTERFAADAQGTERVEFMVSANPGQPLRALRKVASGGELSRISLAIEVAALGLDEIACMVFDEVDSGIGGAVAEVVGQKLRRLGETRQVLCVTHLPQVAAQGHQHLCVVKSSDGKNTTIRIEALDAKARRAEIARMLGGIEITRETLAHAKQMLESASD